MHYYVKWYVLTYAIVFNVEFLLKKCGILKKNITFLEARAGSRLFPKERHTDLLPPKKYHLSKCFELPNSSRFFFKKICHQKNFLDFTIKIFLVLKFFWTLIPKNLHS